MNTTGRPSRTISAAFSGKTVPIAVVTWIVALGKGVQDDAGPGGRRRQPTVRGRAAEC